MLELLAQTSQPDLDLIDWLNNNAAAIQAFSSLLLVVVTAFLVWITATYARSVKRHIRQDRDLFELERQDLRARRRADNLKPMKAVILELCMCSKEQCDEKRPSQIRGTDHDLAAEMTLANIGARTDTIKAVDNAYSAIRAYSRAVAHFSKPSAPVVGLPDPTGSEATEIKRTVAVSSFGGAKRAIDAAIDALEKDPATSSLTAKIKTIYCL